MLFGLFMVIIAHYLWSFCSQHAVDAVSAGVSPVGDTSYNSSHWDLGSAFFFAGTVITTIGNSNLNVNDQTG